MVRLVRRLLGRPLYPDSLEPAFAREVGLAARLERRPPSPSGQSFAQRSIYESWASPWMFHVLEMDERSNAWAGVEGRHPFYDRRVLEFVFAIPEQQRARLDLTKVVLRNAMTGLLPERVRQRRTKARFDRVFIDTFNRLGGERLFETMALETQGWVSARRMRQLCRERLATYPSNLWPLWTAFAIELWFRVMFATPPECVRPHQTAPSRATLR
jgi:asparagine synthase (glutamine-hydrolysing)